MPKPSHEAAFAPPESPSSHESIESVRRTYAEGAEEARTAAARSDRTADLLGTFRLGAALGILVLLLLPLATRSDGPLWGILPVLALFFGIGVAQDRALERRRKHRAGERYLNEGLMRLDDSWRALPATGEEAGAPWRGGLHHADDLDLFGRASLFQLINRAQTERGQRVLAQWLCEPVDVGEAKARQDAVRELREKLDFRLSLATAAASEEAKALDDASIRKWAHIDDPIPYEKALRILGLVFPAVLFVTYGIYWAGGPGQPFGYTVIAQLLALFATRKIVGSRLDVLSGPERALRRASRLVEAVEAASFESPWLQKAQAPLRKGPASSQIRRLEKMVNLLDARLNVIFALTVGPALMWDLNLVLRAERWRREHGARVSEWFETVGAVEAAASLAAFSFERPDYGFADFASEEEACFDSAGLRHPLIAPTQVVENDLRLGGPGSVLLLSGSNMSGKSTLLRSVGLAVVLARAGAPVPARALRVSPFRLATSVRVVDSLADGTSHFFAELKRLKHIVDEGEAHGERLLYLLDEVLHGTNSRERYIGAVSVIRWLSRKGASGIVTTHDLALARVAEDLPDGRTRNCHFSDIVEEDRFRFDYRLREGPVQSTNALRLMKAVGIDVEYDAPELDAPGPP